MKPNTIDRILADLVDKTDGCWIWIGGKTYGYGHASYEGKDVRAHRLVYELLVGPIPQGLQLDHLCRNRACVNPAHLEPVTGRENKRRANALKTHCPHGHPYSGDNLRLSKMRTGGRVQRQCKTCSNQRNREWLARKAKT